MSHLPLSQEHEEIGSAVVRCAFKVHDELGPGLLEKFYEACLCYELEQEGFEVLRQVHVPLKYKNVVFDEALRMDILVNRKVIVEVKAVENVNPVWPAQLLSHLKLTANRLGFLINFNVPLIKQGIKRMVH